VNMNCPDDASKNKEIIPEKMTLEQIAEGQKLSRELCARIPNCAE